MTHSQIIALLGLGLLIVTIFAVFLYVDYLLWLRAWRRMGLKALEATKLGPGAGFYLTIRYWGKR